MVLTIAELESGLADNAELFEMSKADDDFDGLKAIGDELAFRFFVHGICQRVASGKRRKFFEIVRGFFMKGKHDHSLQSQPSDPASSVFL